MPSYIVESIEFARVYRRYRVEADSTDDAITNAKSGSRVRVKLITQRLDQNSNGELVTDGAFLLQSVRAEAELKRTATT